MPTCSRCECVSSRMEQPVSRTTNVSPMLAHDRSPPVASSMVNVVPEEQAMCIFQDA